MTSFRVEKNSQRKAKLKFKNRKKEHNYLQLIKCIARKYLLTTDDRREM